MRYVLAAIFVCAIGTPGASALPTIGADSFSWSSAASITQVAKRSRPQPQRQSRKDSGIRPLVGSGDY